jgi:histidine ammonia-lyase
MATFAANRLHHLIDNVSRIVAIELLSAAQGMDFHHPSRSSALLESAHADIRNVSPIFERDRSLKPDVDDVAALIESGRFYETCRSILPSA